MVATGTKATRVGTVRAIGTMDVATVAIMGGRLRMLAPMAGELATSAIIAIGKPESAGRDRIHFVQLHT